jgi:hypothetical protein
LRIRNSTGSVQSLWVYGVLWTVRRNEVSYVPVPPGPVTVRRRFDPRPKVIVDDNVRWVDDKLGYYVEYDYKSGTLTNP